MSQQLFLGIDQSYTSTGICLVQGDQMIHFERFVSDKTKEIFEKCWDVASYVRKIIKDHKPAAASIEGLAFGMMGNATRDLAGLQFSVITSVRFADGYESLAVVTPLTLKKFATGSGKAKKEDMIAALPTDVLERFKEKGFKKTTGLADLADAYWLARFTQHTEGAKK